MCCVNETVFRFKRLGHCEYSVPMGYWDICAIYLTVAMLQVLSCKELLAFGGSRTCYFLSYFARVGCILLETLRETMYLNSVVSMVDMVCTYLATLFQKGSPKS